MDCRKTFLLFVAVAAVAGLGGTVRAGSLEPPAGPIGPSMKTLNEVEARTPLRQANLPITISVDGAYYLAENLNALQNGANMITVFATNASIDLNGFTINGTSQVAQAADCIRIENTVRGFGLANGLIQGCGQHGVVKIGATEMSVSIQRVRSNQNGGSGIQLAVGAYGVISECVAKGNGDRGIQLAEGIIEDSVTLNNGTFGLQVGSGLIRGCMTKWNTIMNVISGGLLADTYYP